MKRGMFNFATLLAIIAGGAILALAIYGALSFSDNQRLQSDTETAKKIQILTDPLSAGFAEGSFGKISFPDSTRLNNYCYTGEFGKNEIAIATKSRIGEEWNEEGMRVSVHNKYLFSGFEEGEEFYVFSKGFEFPYEVSDLIFITSRDYCFKDVPGDVEDELRGLNVPNVKFENCTGIEVCFEKSCDISVYGLCSGRCDSKYDYGYVEKEGERLDFVGSLIYGAIFSKNTVYECNLNRLMYRTERIADVLRDKAELMDARGCNSNLQADLAVFQSMLMNNTGEDILQVYGFAREMDKKNDLVRGACGLW